MNKSHDDLRAMRGIGLALAAGLALWVGGVVAVSVVTTPMPAVTQVASYPSICSDVDDDSLTSGCN